jgi:hypothetical protein
MMRVNVQGEPNSSRRPVVLFRVLDKVIAEGANRKRKCLPKEIFEIAGSQMRIEQLLVIITADISVCDDWRDNETAVEVAAELSAEHRRKAPTAPHQRDEARLGINATTTRKMSSGRAYKRAGAETGVDICSVSGGIEGDRSIKC